MTAPASSLPRSGRSGVAQLLVLAIVVLTSLPFPIELLRHWLRARRDKR